TFGRAVIRSFSHNVADLSKLSARDFEDILQCCMPCFEGLFPEQHDKAIQELLFTMSYWHSLAKLRMHTESTLQVLEQVTVLLGQRLRLFASATSTDPGLVAYETDREYQARGRAFQRRQAQQPSTGASLGGKRRKIFNLITAKLHFLGYYILHIRIHGTTDGFTTHIVSCRLSLKISPRALICAL
ncbi:hypothetical protein CONPUDRAFT_57037, partial [Coniophora puteana RWD-64-598 SS2]